MSDVTRRALRLLSLLQSRSVWTGPELAAELGVTTRTVRRDVDRLRELGYPVLTSNGHGGGYQLGAGRELPPLLLSEKEAVAVAVGLRLTAAAGIEGLDQEALRALAALERILPGALRAEVGAVSEAMGVVGRALPQVSSDVLLELATSVRDRVRVRLDYRRGDGERSQRRLEPYRVLAVDGHWYLYAWDLDREDWRTFRLDRMAEVHASTFGFTPRETGDVEQAVREAIAVSPYPKEVTVRVHLPVEQVSAMVPARAGTLTADGPDACLLRAGGNDLRGIALHLTWMDGRIEVIDPPELLEQFTWIARRAGEVAGDVDGADKGRRPDEPGSG
ncbi:YafY family transcriptional regulator [Brachybacterium sp. p3-SID1565]|uniref:helix-turn-helix transcriptional regulator n=1 Tax=Brachybacterium sp. p3-SID1565 TaxID=2916046 RepID=UPI0021A7B9B4|nr:YafY family protein [Brachybacterium sp. p3-SID1565]MCT1385766.1 YafY family transcriptional regulator [Brachybacterium sp. p3-SID1565]